MEYIETQGGKTEFMEGKVVTRAASKAVVMGWTGPYAYAKEIPSLWKTFVERTGEITGRKVEDSFISPCHDRETDFTCYVGVEVDESENVPEGMMALTIPEHKYAVFTHQGPMSTVHDTYMKIFAWLKEHGYEKDMGAFTLELYDNRYRTVTDDPDSPTNAYDIYVPVR